MMIFSSSIQALASSVGWRIAAVAALSGAIAKLLDAWLKPATKDRMTERLAEIWLQVAERDPLSLVRAPLLLFSTFFDRVYGARLISWKAFWRCSVVSLALLISALLVAGAYNPQLSDLGMPPWVNLDQALSSWQTSLQLQLKRKDIKPQEKRLYANLLQRAKSYNNSRTRILYTLIACVLAVACVTTAAFLCTAVARLVLRDIQRADTLMTMAALALTNCVIATATYSISLVLLCAIAAPISWSFILLVGMLLPVTSSWLVGFGLILAALLLFLVFSPMWIKCAAVISILPSATILVISFVSAILLPWRAHIRRGSVYALDRALAYENGVLLFFAVSFASLSLIVPLFASLLFGIRQ